MPSQLDSARIDQLVEHYRPNKWSIVQKKSHAKGGDGSCSYPRRTIYVPPVVDDYSFFVYLHEVAHATNRTDKPGHQDEYLAERWAMSEFRNIGVRVTREILRQAKHNVLGHVIRDRKKNIAIDPAVWKWVDPNAPTRDKARYRRRIA